MQTLILKNLVWLTLLVHFMLPYAAMSAEQTNKSHASPLPHAYNEDYGEDPGQEEHLEELPHHIEPSENELEELDESGSHARTPHQQAHHIDNRPYGVFFYRQHFGNHGRKEPQFLFRGLLCPRNILRL